MVSHTKLRGYLYGIGAPRLAFTLAMLNMATAVMAEEPANVTREEWALIPAYCPHAQGWSRDWYGPDSMRWKAKIGPDFSHMHHYCWGQVNMLRAQKSNVSKQERKRLLELVRGDYLYVTKHSARDFVLLPEVYTRIGEVELRLALYNEANKSFAQARALKPDYWPAYSHWAEFLIRSGKRAEAKQVVKSGLDYSPGSRVLREQYRLVGGNPSDIMPRVIGPTPDGPTGETAASGTKKQPSRAKETGEASQSTNPDK
jgi:tetratricopeptide (TPR) repeat protein